MTRREFMKGVSGACGLAVPFGAAPVLGGCAARQDAAASVLKPLELLPTHGVCGEAWLETLRAAAAACRLETPDRPVGGASPTAAEALRFLKEFLATGEAEELDFWNIRDPRAPYAEIVAVRTLLDGAGGRAVKLLVGGHPWAPFASAGLPAGEVLMTGSGRILTKEPNGAERIVRIGCGNVHRAISRGGWIWYSNGALLRAKVGAPPEAKPECVWRAPLEKGAAVLGFDITPEGHFAMAVNSTDEVVVYDPVARAVVRRFKVDARLPGGATPSPHGHLRMIHATPTGTYLVSCASAGMAREYDKEGKLVWEQGVPKGFVFDAIRLSNGNTLLSHLDGITEFSPSHARVWSFGCAEAPELKLQFLCSVQEHGAADSFTVGTWANGRPAGDRVTAFEVSRGDKRILWAYASASEANMMSVRR